MKTLTNKSILFTIVILSSLQLFAQTEKSVVISADNLKVLYFGIDNPISIAANGITNDKLDVSITNGILTGRNGKYIAKPGSGQISIIVVSTVNESGEINPISSDTFRVEKIPVPKAFIGYENSPGLYLSKDELLSNPEINVSWNFPFDLSFKILSFRFSYIENGDFISEKVNGSKFTPEIIDAIKRMDGGSKIYFDGIEAIGPDDAVRTLDPIIIKLADKG